MAEQTPVRLEITLSRARWEKLVATAEASGLTVLQAIERWIDSCQPGGSGWQSPDARARGRERAERREGRGE